MSRSLLRRFFQDARYSYYSLKYQNKFVTRNQRKYENELKLSIPLTKVHTVYNKVNRLSAYVRKKTLNRHK